MMIDADAHVIETERTWDYMDESESKIKPVLVSAGNDSKQYWIIDGRAIPTRTVFDWNLPEDNIEMRDIDGRLRHMKELGIDVQVLYPTLFLRPLTTRPKVELALCKSYNRWIADICRKGGNQLRWIAVLPLMSMGEALAEARFAKENGACGIVTRAIEGNRLMIDPYFFPLYEEASRLSLAICPHASTGSFEWFDLFEEESGFAKFKLPILSAFHSIVYEGIPDKFPGLRFGFIEIRAQWLPYVITDLAKRFKRRGKPLGKNLLRDNRLYVTCQTDDDLPYILKYSGQDNLVIGTDYGHGDTAAEVDALRVLRQKSEISGEALDKILCDNPKALYDL